MEFLKVGLTPQEYDRVRDVLGLQPLKDATESGRQITQNIRNAVA
jgi:hypothetical protein